MSPSTTGAAPTAGRTPARTRGHKKKERTRRHLLSAAVEVIAERGEAFSISDVVAQAEVSNGTFYNYFPDREALMEAVVPELITSLAEDLAEAVTEDDPAQRFATITSLALRRAAVAPDEMRAILRLEAIQQAMVADGPLSNLRADLAEGVASGRFTIADDEAALDIVAGALIMATRRIIDSGPNPDHERALLEHLLRSLGVAKHESATIAARAVQAR